GLAYTWRPPENVVAFECATGTVLWERRLSGTPIAVRSGHLLLGEIWGLVQGAVRTRDGSIAWSDRLERLRGLSYYALKPDEQNQVTLYGMEPLRLSGQRLALNSAVYTEATVDVRTGMVIRRVQ